MLAPLGFLVFLEVLRDCVFAFLCLYHSQAKREEEKEEAPTKQEFGEKKEEKPVLDAGDMDFSDIVLDVASTVSLSNGTHF